MGKPTPHQEILLNVTPENGAIRQGNWKLVGNGRISANYAGNKPEIDTFELFNLADDPYEKNDLSEKYPDKLKELQDRLKSYAQEAAPANFTPNSMPQEYNIPKAWGHPDS
jgi:arylsulfatase A-like enzyme